MAELFYPLGLGLTALAVVVSFFGLRNKEFPGSKGALAGGIAIFAVLVFATMATGVKNAEEEQDHRENQEAEEAAQETELENEAAQAEDVGQAGGGAAGAQLEQDTSGQSGGTGGQSDAKGGQAGGTVDLSAPEDGSLAFEPDSLQAPAGNVTIKFTNPATVGHDVHIEGDGEDLAASDVVADGETTEASADLEPGDYTFYCSIPGHREGGMEGTLTVD
jgi:plastocyanin